MKFIAYGALHFLDGSASELFARFERENGATFDMPISELQLDFLLQQAGVGGDEAATVDHQQERQAPVTAPAAPRPPGVIEMPVGASIRLVEPDDDDDDPDGGGL